MKRRLWRQSNHFRAVESLFAILSKQENSASTYPNRDRDAARDEIVEPLAMN
jgi:hypothetical protein